MERPDPARIAALINSVDDATLETQVTELGLDSVLGQIFEEMARRFLPFRAQGKRAVVQYDIRLRDGSVRSWQMRIADGACDQQPGAGWSPQVTAQIALPKFLRLLTGSLEPTTAFMSGALKLRGDVLLAHAMQDWFDRVV